MDAKVQILSSISNFIIFLAVVPALWVSGRMILKNATQYDRAIQLFLWLVLGGFFLIPLIDLLSSLRSLVSLIVSPEENMLEMQLFLGRTSWFLYSAINLVVAVAIYAVAIVYGRRFLTEYGRPVIERLSLNDTEQVFIILGLAGLLSSMIHGIIANFLWILNTEANRTVTLGDWGAILGWVLGFLMLLLAVLLMNQRLDKEEG